MPTMTSGVMRMSIRATAGGAVFTAEVEAKSLQNIRWTGEALQITADVHVSYGFGSDAQMGYHFEFTEGPSHRLITVPAKDIAWMMMDPDVQEALMRR